MVEGRLRTTSFEENPGLDLLEFQAISRKAIELESCNEYKEDIIVVKSQYQEKVTRIS
jgi:hypothetical protein